MQEYLDEIKKLTNYANHFKHYLLGFQVSNFLLPPWKFIHFRNFTSKDPFAPYGMPTFIHAIAPYRQYDAGMTIQMVSRGASIQLINMS